MDKANLENQDIREPQGGKVDTNLSALADSMQFLSLGVPGISRPKRFNVNAWSTPLKSIENQQRKVAHDKMPEFECTDDVADESLSNLSDLFPGQNVFEKTLDFIDYYHVNATEESIRTPAAKRTSLSTSAHLTGSPNQPMMIDHNVSNMTSNYSGCAKKSTSFSHLPIGLSEDVENRCPSPHSAKKARVSEKVSTDSTVSPIKSFENTQPTSIELEVDRSVHLSSDISTRSSNHTSPAVDERRVESLESPSCCMSDGNGNDVESADCPTSLPDYEGNSKNNQSAISDPPIDDENDVSSCDSTVDEDNFFLAVSHIEDELNDSSGSRSGQLDNVEEEALQGQCENGATEDIVGYTETNVELISKCDDEADVALSTVDGSPCLVSEEVGHKSLEISAGIRELDDECVMVSSSASQSPAKLDPEVEANCSTYSDQIDYPLSLPPSPVSCASSSIRDSLVELELDSSVPSSHPVDLHFETVDQTEGSASAELSSLTLPTTSNDPVAVTGTEANRDEQTAYGVPPTIPQSESCCFQGLNASSCDLYAAGLTPTIMSQSSNEETVFSGVEAISNEQIACDLLPNISPSKTCNFQDLHSSSCDLYAAGLTPTIMSQCFDEETTFSSTDAIGNEQIECNLSTIMEESSNEQMTVSDVEAIGSEQIIPQSEACNIQSPDASSCDLYPAGPQPTTVSQSSNDEIVFSSIEATGDEQVVCNLPTIVNQSSKEMVFSTAEAICDEQIVCDQFPTISQSKACDFQGMDASSCDLYAAGLTPTISNECSNEETIFSSVEAFGNEQIVYNLPTIVNQSSNEEMLFSSAEAICDEQIEEATCDEQIEEATCDEQIEEATCDEQIEEATCDEQIEEATCDEQIEEATCDEQIVSDLFSTISQSDACNFQGLDADLYVTGLITTIVSQSSNEETIVSSVEAIDDEEIVCDLPTIVSQSSNEQTAVSGHQAVGDELIPCGLTGTILQSELCNIQGPDASNCDLYAAGPAPTIVNQHSNEQMALSGVEIIGDEQIACDLLPIVLQSELCDSHSLDALDCDPMTPSPSVDSSPLDVVSVESVLDTEYYAVCDKTCLSSEVYESGNADHEKYLVNVPSPLTSPLASNTVSDDVEYISQASTPIKDEGLSPRTETTSPEDQTPFVAAVLTSEPQQSDPGPTVVYCDDVVSLSANSIVQLSSDSAEIASSVDDFLHHDENALDTTKCVTVSVDDSLEDGAESQHSSSPSQQLTAERKSRTLRSEGSDNDHSFASNFSDSPDLPIKENECSVVYEVENECDFQESDSLDKTIIISTPAKNPPSENCGHPSTLAPSLTPNFHDPGSMDVINELEEVHLETDGFYGAVNAISTDEHISHQQAEKINFSLKTPIKPANHGQNLPSDKLARVCDSMNKLMSLCTPMKDLRTQSRTPIIPFRCENVGGESQKIVFDFPPSLLDVSIGMLESMTAMMAPAVESASNVTHFDEENIASDLISVAQTPKVIQTQSNQIRSSSRPNLRNINEHLLEENENLKKELEVYKKKYDSLQEEYDSLLKTAYALRTNETTLKEALQEYEDETRKACNKYLLLKEYSNDLIILLNRSLDQCEQELKMKTEELQKLRSSS